MTPGQSHDLITSLQNRLPKGFDFYHLGNVEIREQKILTHELLDLKLEDMVGVTFHFQGDFRGILLILVEKGMDMSIYSEMGNILAGRIAVELFQDGYDVMISPPRIIQEVLENENLMKLLKSDDKKIHGKYAHVYQSSAVFIETVLIPYAQERVGYA
jgi:hypothetical protein